MYAHSPRRGRTSCCIYIRSLLFLLSLLSSPSSILIAQSDATIPTLELGKPIERELSGQQSHSYQIVLTSGQYIHVVADQRGIDVVVRLLGPDNKQLLEVDSPNGNEGPEHVYFIAAITGRHRLEVRSLDKLARGRYQVTLEELRAARETDSQRIDAEALFGEASMMFGVGTKESLTKALEKYQQALSFFRSLNDSSREAATLSTSGLICDLLGNKQKALDYDAQALPLYRAVGDRRNEALTLNNIGSVYDSLGEKQKALDYYTQSLPLRRIVGDRDGEAATLLNIGEVYAGLGERQKALDYYLQALPLFRAASDHGAEGLTLNNIGRIYDALGEKQKALDYYAQALPLYRAVGDRRNEALTLQNTGGVYGDLGQKEKALDYLSQALSLFRAVGDRRGEAMALNNAGGVYRALGEKQKTLDHYLQALSLFRAIGNRVGEAASLNNVGWAYDDLGERQRAFEYFAQALPVFRAVEDLNGEATVLSGWMNFYKLQKNDRLAIFYGKESVDAYEQLRSKIRGLDTAVQRTYLKSVEQNFRGLADLLIRQRRFAEAQEVLNAFKDQQFFDFDGWQSKQLMPLTRTPREAEFRTRYGRARDTLGAIGGRVGELKRKFGGRQLRDEAAGQLQQLETEYNSAADEFSRLLKQAEAEFLTPTSDKDEVQEVRDTVEMQAALRQLSQETGQNAVVVYTIIGEPNVQALIITPDSIASVSSTMLATELDEKARQLWALLKSSDYDPRSLSNELYKAIFKPIESRLPKDTKTIMWSLDGNLRYIPVAALHDGKQYLVERYNHVVFTRADKERLTRNVHSTWTGYGFATSEAHTVNVDNETIAFGSLDFARDEMQIFRTRTYRNGVIDGDVYAEAEFTRVSFLATLKQKRPLVHISSHFRFHPGDASNSFLLLGDGQVMTLAEMKEEPNLFQGVELLTLSACDTAAQRPDANGREIDAFAELAQRLGAAGVMASLWPVLDRSTTELMNAFYKDREGGKITKAEALRTAQLDLLYGRNVNLSVRPPSARGPDTETPRKRGSADENVVVEPKYRIPFKVDKKKPFAHPYYWSPFVLFGNWK